MNVTVSSITDYRYVSLWAAKLPNSINRVLSGSSNSNFAPLDLLKEPHGIGPLPEGHFKIVRITDNDDMPLLRCCAGRPL